MSSAAANFPDPGGELALLLVDPVFRGSRRMSRYSQGSMA
jgi:hypothetical protein